MLILLQNGRRAVNLKNVSCIEVCRLCPTDLVVHYIYHGDAPKIAKGLSPAWVKTFYLGSFGSEEGAIKALDDIVTAYGRGARIYRIPKYEVPNTEGDKA